MNKHFLAFIMLVFLSFHNLIGQPSVFFQEEKFIQLYGDNEALKQGKKLTKEGKRIEARDFFKQAAKTFETENKWELYALTIAKLISSYVNTENYKEGIQIAENGIRKIQSQAPEQIKLTSFLYHEMAFIYLFASKVDLALNAHQKQLEILKKVYRLDSNWEFVMAYFNIGRIHLRLGNPDKALEYYKNAQFIVEKLDLQNAYWSRTVYIHLIRLYMNHFLDLETAVKVSKKALKLAEDKYERNSYEIIPYYLRVGEILRFMEEKTQSNIYYQKALSIENQYELNNYELEILKSLAENHYALENFDEALRYYRESLVFPKRNAIDSSHDVTTLLYMGGIYQNINEYEEALRHFEKAENLLQSLTKKIKGSSRLFHAKRAFHWHYAEFWKAKGQPLRAKKHYWALVNELTVKGGEWNDAENWRDLATIFENEGKRDSAFYCNQKALITLCDNFQSLDPNILPEVDDVKALVNVYNVLQQKIWLHQVDAADSKEEIQKARYRKAVEVADLADAVHLRNMKNMSVLRAGNSDQLIRYSGKNYKQSIEMAYEAFSSGKLESAGEKAFYYAQRVKAQNLWLSLLKSDAVSFGVIDQALLEQERALLKEMNVYEKKLLEAEYKKDTQSVEQIQNEHLFELKKSFGELQQVLEKKYPKYFESKYNFVAETIESVQKILKKEEVLVEYVFTDSSLYALTISKNQPVQFFKNPIPENLKEDIKALNQMLQNSAMLRKSSREKFIRLSHKLYNQFLQPIENQLFNKKRLIIIGDAYTNFIPFETLLQLDEMKPFNELDFLIKKIEVSYHYSATLFAKTRGTSLSRNRGIYAFAPVFDYVKTDTTNNTEEDGYRNSGTLRAFQPDGNFSPLPESETEVKSIIELFNENEALSENVLSLREDAKEHQLKEHLEQPYQFIHIAGHSFANLENPKFSGIACYKEEDKEEDGMLYMGEIYTLHSKADLVTLSSCESGFGKLETTEGILGLNRAFVYAGTPNVVFSLWKVYDKISAKLMVDFYKNILDGKDYSESLRAAKLNLLNDEATAAPHFWSPYLLIGR